MSTRLRSRAAAGVLCLGLAGGVALPVMSPASAAPVVSAPAAPTSIPVTGSTATGSFAGSLSNLTVSTVGGALQVTGTVTGTLTDATTGVTTAVNDTFTAVLQDLDASGACRILELDLGPLNLDLLGLVIDLNRVQLDITAVTGSGNLLGNLLCAVTGLFDGTAPLQSVARVLNQLLTSLGL